MLFFFLILSCSTIIQTQTKRIPQEPIPRNRERERERDRESEREREKEKENIVVDLYISLNLLKTNNYKLRTHLGKKEKQRRKINVK